MNDLPSGIVTFLFTDIEGYTRGFEAAPEAMARAVARHDALVREAVESAGGFAFKTIGDAFQIAFAQPQQALQGAVEAQRRLATEDWAAIDGLPGPLRVRMAIDVVPAAPSDGDYRTPRLNRIARLMAAAHGGQVVVTGDAVAALADRMRAGVVLRALGAHRLKDLREPVTAFQAVADGVPDVTTPLRTAGPLTTRDRIIVVDPQAADRSGAGEGGRPVAAMFADLLAVVRGEAETAQLTVADVRALVAHRPADEQAYRLIRLASGASRATSWTTGSWRFRCGSTRASRRPRTSGRRARALRRFGRAHGRGGRPGARRARAARQRQSTLLRRLELDLAIESLRAGVPSAGGAALADEPRSRRTWFVPSTNTVSKAGRTTPPRRLARRPLATDATWPWRPRA
ncbi:MAG: adenylate/guanylate cyclase domain-containing protein [Anaerolineae bacterium]